METAIVLLYFYCAILLLDFSCGQTHVTMEKEDANAYYRTER